MLFIWWELRTPNPALDVRLFRFRAFNAAVAAGAVINFSMGGIVQVARVPCIAEFRRVPVGTGFVTALRSR